MAFFIGSTPDNSDFSGNDTDEVLLQFCGPDLFNPISKDGTHLGLCFRVLALYLVPFLLIMISGGMRLFFLISLHREQQQESYKKKYRVKKMKPRKKIWFWTKFFLAIIILLSSQTELIYIAARGSQSSGNTTLEDPDVYDLHDDGLSPLIVNGIGSALAWALCAGVMYLEYNTHMPHTGAMRLFWILQAIMGIVEEISIILQGLKAGTSPGYWTAEPVLATHLTAVLQVILAVLGAIGWHPRYGEFWEPIVNKRWLQKKMDDFSFKDILMLLSPNKYWWIAAITFCVAEGVLTIMYLKVLSDIIGDSTVSEEQLWSEVGLFFAYACAAGVCSFVQASCFGQAGFSMVENFRKKILQALMKQELAYFDTTSPGALISYLSSDTDKVGRLREVFPLIINPLSQCLYGAVVLFQTSWQLTGVVIALLAIEFIEASIRSRSVSHKYAVKYAESNSEVADRGTEILSAITTVRLFVQEEKELGSYASYASSAASVGRKKEVLEAIFEAVEYLLYAAIIGIGVIYSYRLEVTHVMPAKGMTDFILIGVTMVTEFQMVIKSIPEFAAACGPAAALMKIVKREPAFNSNEGETLQSLKGDIEFVNVSFRYPPREGKKRNDESVISLDGDEEQSKVERSNSGFINIKVEPYIFEDFNLKIPAGTSCAFVGPSGCGKSTIFSLMLRSYEISKGSIKIDGVLDLKKMKLKWWLRNVGVVTQESRLFKGTLRDNILYGIEKKQRNKILQLDQLIMEAVHKANLQKLVADKGLDFQVGERGSALSGGQKQRVCIARIFMKQPKILLLDEVTSALDPISEAEVMKALEQLMVGRTTFVIAHRLHTLTNIDRIFVLREGKIVDQGSHSQLVDKPGFYKTMWDKQQKDTAVTGERVARGFPKSDVSSLLDLLERFERTLPAEVVSMLYQLRPKDDDSDAEEDDIGAAETDDDTTNKSAYRVLVNEKPYTKGPILLTGRTTSDDD